MRRYLGFAATALLVSQVSAGVNHAVIAEGVAGANDADVKQHDTKSDFQRAIDEKIGLLRGTAEALNAMPSSPPSEKATSAPHSTADKAVNEIPHGKVVNVEVPWVGADSMQPSPEVSLSTLEHHANTLGADNEVSSPVNGRVQGPGSDWTVEKSELVGHLTDKRPVVENRRAEADVEGTAAPPDRIVSNPVPWEKLFPHERLEGEAGDEAIDDGYVRWDQDDCNPCEVPTLPPTLPPAYPHGDADYEDHLPTVNDANEPWKDVYTDAPTEVSTLPPVTYQENVDYVDHLPTVNDDYEPWTEVQEDLYTDAPTEDPTLPPVVYQENVDYEDHLPIVTDEYDDWQDIEDNLPTYPPATEASDDVATDAPAGAPYDTSISFHSTQGPYEENEVDPVVSTEEPTAAEGYYPWDDIKDNVVTYPPQNEPTEGPSDALSDTDEPANEGEYAHCVKVIGDYGERYECDEDPEENSTETPATPPVEEGEATTEPPATPPVEEGESTTEPPATSPVQEGEATTEPPATPPVEEGEATTEPPATPPVEEGEATTEPPATSPVEEGEVTTAPLSSTAPPTNGPYVDTYEPTPAPSEPIEPEGEPTPAPTSYYDEPTPAPTSYYDEPTPTPAVTKTDEDSTYPSGTTSSNGTTSGGTTTGTTTGTSTGDTATAGTTDTTSTDTGAASNAAGTVTSDSTTTSSNSSAELSTPAIVGIVVGGAVFVAVVVGAVLFWQKSVARQREENLFADLSDTGGGLETDYAAM
jgi:hypothetical protein